MTDREQTRLIRRIAHLHTILSNAADDRIVVAVKEFIAETEAQLVALQTKRSRKATLH